MMNMISTKKLSGVSAVSPITGADLLAVLKRQIAKLVDRDKELLKQQIQLESTAGSAQSDAHAYDISEAQRYLDGEPFTPTRTRPMAQIAAILAERALIAKALTIANSEYHRVATERAGDVWASHFAEIAAIEKRRVLLAIELQRTNRAREVLRGKITAAGGAGFLSTDGAELLYFVDAGDEVHWAGERLIADGIATRAEIEKARSSNG
jgi:hypothetical protein